MGLAVTGTPVSCARPARVAAGCDPPGAAGGHCSLRGSREGVKLCRQGLRSLSCPLDEPFSNPLAPDGHDVDDSHSFHQ